MSKPRCPVCGRKGQPCGELYRCSLGHLFDSTPDEGGSHWDDPTKRIERADEERAARRHNLERRTMAASGFRMPRR